MGNTPRIHIQHTAMSNQEHTATLNKFELGYRVTKWIKTMRIQTALVTSLAVWVGYVSVANLTVESTIILGAIGLFFHIFGFTMNEVEDYEYDASIGNGSEHPIAKGEVHAGIAKYVAWMAFTVAICISALSGYSTTGTLMLLGAAIPGVMYNKFSKVHWWSNAYLSIWAVMMVIAGALHAGTPNQVTYMLAIAIAIQIFIQVMEGDMKDLTGNEDSVCRRMGVKLQSSHEYIKQTQNAELENLNYNDASIVSYTKKFGALLYGSKIIELGLLIAIASSFVSMAPFGLRLYGLLYFTTTIIFVSSLSMVTVYVYDRNRIKQMSSIHELSAIVLIGLTVFPLQHGAGVLIALGPIMWYLGVNKVIHSGALNPDI